MGPCTGVSPSPTLDVPYMDNIFLAHRDESHRVALLLLDMNKTEDGVYHVKFAALLFPDHMILPSAIPSPTQVKNAIDAAWKDDDPSH